MTAAFETDTFAVVDLETTGTQRQEHDRIIQFGCAIIKHRQIIKTYSFLMNPHRRIPLAVENLTNIRNEEVRGQHDFAYYAPEIEKILSDTIFVAHNVNFDLPFLNYELTNAGYEPLTGKAIDTVELAQIVFPTYPSYKLRDLTTRLAIPHLNPHRADSDALVTAQLLLKIIKKIEQLPQVTLNTLTALSKGLVRDTNDIFSEISRFSRQSRHPLNKQFIQIRNIVLRKQQHHLNKNHAKTVAFPKTDREKKLLFQGKVNFRRAQVSLMNRLRDFMSNPQEETLLVEAPNGTGKTLSYLLAYAYDLYSGKKLVIATPTKVLQEQILHQEVPQLLKVTGLDLNAQVVKASSHYLDLDGFMQTLYQSNITKQTLILQMGILVWLTETQTGDLDELQLTNFQAPLFSQIAHPGDARFGTPFSDYDFWNLARYCAEQADILVTNHAYLANHYIDSIWGQKPYLVVDEAHRFADYVAASRNDGLEFESFWGMLSHLRHILYFADESVAARYSEDAHLDFLLKQLDPKIIDLIHRINHFQSALYAHRSQAISSTKRPNGSIELGVMGSQLFENHSEWVKLLTQLQLKLESVRQLTSQILYQLYQQQDGMVVSDHDILTAISQQIDRLDDYTEKAYLFSDELNDLDVLQKMGFILIISDPKDPLSTNLRWLILRPNEILKRLYQRFTKKLFISATLTDRGDFAFAAAQLTLEKETYLTYHGRNTFDLTKHLRVYTLVDSTVPQDPNSKSFTDYLSRFLLKGIRYQSHCLVLFTNLETIKTVCLAIMNAPQLKDYEILAQGLTGSNDRIAKRFKIAKKAILLGANSFWEGVDFHDTSVDLAIVTKLPFESPDQPEVQLRAARLKQQRIDVFNADTLPRAVLRFRQGCGRLTRSERDKGIYVVLDQRLWLNKYGSAFLESLPVRANKVDEKTLIAKLAESERK